MDGTHKRTNVAPTTAQVAWTPPSGNATTSMSFTASTPSPFSRIASFLSISRELQRVSSEKERAGDEMGVTPLQEVDPDISAVEGLITVGVRVVGDEQQRRAKVALFEMRCPDSERILAEGEDGAG